MNILLVEFTSAVSGAERSLLELLQGLRGEHELTLACPLGPLARRAAELGVRVTPIPSSQLTFRIHPRETARGALDMARAARRLRAIVRNVRPDVVHANSIRAGLLAVPATRGLSPVVVHCRDALPSGIAGAAVAAVVLAGADHVVAISRHVAATVVRTRWGGLRVTVVDNPVDVARFDPALHSRARCRAALGLGDGLVLSVIAQITPWKGQDLAIEAAGELRRRGREVILLIVGEAKFVGAATRHDNRAFEGELHALVDAQRLADRVRFLGEREDPERILAATDVLLVPSTEEPFGRTIIEAMAMGVPVAATGVGGPREILSGGVGGLVVESRQPAAWADAAEELAEWPCWRRVAARDVVEARFTRERHTARMLQVYATALMRRARPSPTQLCADGSSRSAP